MPNLTKITLSTIAYVTEEKDLVEQALLNCIPEKLKSVKLNKQALQSQFNDQLIIYSLIFENTNEVTEVVNFISQNLKGPDKDYLDRHFSSKINLENKSFYFRLDKFEAVDSKLKLIEGSDIIKIEIKYSAFTQEENTFDKVKDFFQQRGLIST